MLKKLVKNGPQRVVENVGNKVVMHSCPSLRRPDLQFYISSEF